MPAALSLGASQTCRLCRGRFCGILGRSSSFGAPTLVAGTAPPPTAHVSTVLSAFGRRALSYRGCPAQMLQGAARGQAGVARASCARSKSSLSDHLGLLAITYCCQASQPSKLACADSPKAPIPEIGIHWCRRVRTQSLSSCLSSCTTGVASRAIKLLSTPLHMMPITRLLGPSPCLDLCCSPLTYLTYPLQYFVAPTYFHL